jgi:hypothetical protein
MGSVSAQLEWIHSAKQAFDDITIILGIKPAQHDTPTIDSVGFSDRVPDTPH